MNNASIHIRSERPSDYASIAAVTYEAFLGWQPDNQYVFEPLLVDLLRHNTRFDPALSLVAETRGDVVAHALFSPFEFGVMGSRLSGVVLAPIAVKPDYQQQHIGRMLIEEGHQRAVSKGHAFSLLCGHPSYYPRFGYHTKVFSLEGVRIGVDVPEFNGETFDERPVNNRDVPWLQELWSSQYGEAALALFPGTGVCDWSSHSRATRCIVVSRGDRVLGYARCAKGEPLRIKELLASKADMPHLLAYLTWTNYGVARGEVRAAIPYETVGQALTAPGGFEVVDERAAHEPFMVKVLLQDSPAAQYVEKVTQDRTEPGVVSFPSIFDAAE